MAYLIDYQAATIEREEQTLFDRLDFQVAAGEFVYLIGKVGSGKSSLLQTLYGELPVLKSSDKAQVLEHDMCRLKRSKVPYLRRKMGIIFQDFQLLTDRSVGENLRFVLHATGWRKKQAIDERIEKVLTDVGMQSKSYRMPNTLSGGEQQRVVIARALLNEPQILLADEPTGNLDPETGDNIVALLRRIASELNAAVIMSTHNLLLPQKYPGRVLRVEDRKLVDVTAEFVPQTVSQTAPLVVSETSDESLDSSEVDEREKQSSVTEECLEDDKQENEAEVVVKETEELILQENPVEGEDGGVENLVNGEDKLSAEPKVTEVSDTIVEVSEETESVLETAEEISESEEMIAEATEEITERIKEVPEVLEEVSGVVQPLVSDPLEEKSKLDDFEQLSEQIFALKAKLDAVKEAYQNAESRSKTPTSVQENVPNEEHNDVVHLTQQDNLLAEECCSEPLVEKPQE